ncbi:hypothetical protein AB8O55_24715 [Saccharopolyspora cebuensis]|uniref:Uncharacterized protein n=1 Tax=Saccharopolyspora cebuensis TaxID=418759 RepID=A0ABV4CNF4_9PSEU
MTTANIDVPSYYDPREVLAATFDDGLLAIHLGPALTCVEVNVLAAFLDSAGRTDGARYWLSSHQQDCEEPHLH